MEQIKYMDDTVNWLEKECRPVINAHKKLLKSKKSNPKQLQATRARMTELFARVNALLREVGKRIDD